jgi:hypothetical protein
MRLLLLAALSAALGSPPAQDSVTGAADTGGGRTQVDFIFHAHSGPSGESPGGTVDISLLGGPFAALEVSCLSVSGNRATIIAKAPAGVPIAGFQIAVEDGGPGGQDKVVWQLLDTLPASCPPPTGLLLQNSRGDLVVTDAPPRPTSKQMCKDDGWRSYGFRNQGACVSFVNAASRPAR